MSEWQQGRHEHGLDCVSGIDFDPDAIDHITVMNDHEIETIQGPTRKRDRWSRTVTVNGKTKSYVSYQNPSTPIRNLHWVRMPLRFFGREMKR